MIYLTGDTHGEQDRLRYLERAYALGAGDILIICGDFGFLWRGDEAEGAFLDELAERPYTLCFIDGNHENFALLNACPEREWRGGRVHVVRENILHLMRGQVFELEGRRIFTLGGAYSVDRCTLPRIRNVSYWEEELPCAAEYEEARRNLARYGNEVDYVLTHTAPLPIAWQAARRTGHWLDDGDGELMRFLNALRYDLHFRHWYFGHFHDDLTFGEDFTLLFQSVARLE